MQPLSMTQPHAAGSLVSNLDDLLVWNRALHEGRVLGNAAYTLMVTPIGRAAGAGIDYGFGLRAGKVRQQRALRHGGAIAGFMASLYYLPGPDITVAVLENDDATGGTDSADTLARKLAAFALGTPYPELRAVPIEAPALQAAEGVYRTGDTVRVLRMVDGKLTAQRGNGARAVLTPIAADDFLYDDGFNRLTLERGADGRIAGLRFFANGDGEGEVAARTSEPLPGAPVAIQLPRTVLDRLAGTYANGGLTLKIYVEGEALKAQIVDQPPIGLFAKSPIRFEVEQSGASLEFPAGDAPAATVTMRQNGREMVLRRAP
jgi:hypothetical protein